MFRPRRIFPFSRVVSRLSPPSPEGNLFKVHHVKVQRPWIRTFFKRCFLYGVAFHLWSSFVLLQFDGEVDETQEFGIDGPNRNGETRDANATGDAEESLDSDETFVPLGWPQIRQGEPYSASDPEWQEFIRFSRNPEKLKSLKDELASIALRDASRSRLISRLLGGPLTLTRSWLIHYFPQRAPPTYSRPGFNITDHGVSWTSKPMSAEDGDRLLRCARPLYVTHAIKDAFMVLLKRQSARLPLTHLDQDQQEIKASPSKKQESPRDLNSLDGPNRISQSQGSLSSDISRPASQDSPESRLHSTFLNTLLQMLPLPRLEPGSDLFAASVAFRLRLRECWARERHTPPRGIFYISGPVGLRGPKGFCRVEVRGEYDPASARWNRVSIHLKDLNLYKQRALGGS